MTFNSPVAANKHLTVGGDINGVDIVDLDSDAVYGDIIDGKLCNSAFNDIV